MECGDRLMNLINSFSYSIGCSNIFWNNIVNIEHNRGEALLLEMSYMGVWEPIRV